jgi:hypothetical protein
MLRKNRLLYLCAGLQSGGTTLISWCFLQRPDMDGILDANNDVFPDIPPALSSPNIWIKTTISSFRLCEQMAYYQDLGWQVRPLLVCRDLRAVYASLRTKKYGSNGTTAEDPPLRLRLRRFREDWERFRQNRWPILSYERFLLDPVTVLREACSKLELRWDDAMTSWPKPKSDIFDTRHGNDTFRKTCANSLWTSLKPAEKPSPRLSIPLEQLAWLEREFAEFNQINGYAAHLPEWSFAADASPHDTPCFAVTRRAHWRRQQVPFSYILSKIARWCKTSFWQQPRAEPEPVSKYEGLRVRVQPRPMENVEVPVQAQP